MRHDDQRPVARLGFGQPGADSAGKDLIGFAVRRREIPLVTPLLVEGARHQRRDLGARQPIPGAEREFAQPVVKPQRLAAAEAFADDLGGMAGAANRARDEVGRTNFRQFAE